MGTFLFLIVLAFVFQSALTTIRRRLDLAERQLASAGEASARIDALRARIAALESLVARSRSVGGVAPAPERAPVEAGVEVGDAGDAGRTSVVVPNVAQTPDAEPPAAAAVPVAESAVVFEPREAAVPAPGAPAVPAPVAAASSAGPSRHFDTTSTGQQYATPLTSTAPVEAVEPPTADTWELVVGTSWLNKVGVLIFVTGLALLLGYSMTHVGPAGRVLIGFTVGGAMLGTGVWFERNPVYRAFGLGLVAGGWAGIYVTAFAMRVLPAARILESEALGLLALLGVAGGMVAHSLRYRSESVTSLAYAAAYLPLVITPLATSALVSAIPLVASLLIVAGRFGWTTLSLLGVGTTYGLLVLRGRVLPGEPLDGTTSAPFILLGAYWLLFEAADLLTAFWRRPAPSSRSSLFPLNAVGALGVFVSLVDSAPAERIAAALAVTAVLYLASAILRARLPPASVAVAGDARPFSTAHAALAISAGLTAWAIDLRMAGPRETITLLIEAELIFVAGLTLADRQVRRIAAAIAGLVSLHAVAIAAAPSSDLSFLSGIPAWAPALGAVAATWYLNREWLRSRCVVLDHAEHAFPWIALLLAAIVVHQTIGRPLEGLFALGAAVILTEAARRHRPDYAGQAQAALAGGVLALASAAMSFVPRSSEVWLVLPAAAALGYVFAWRHRNVRTVSRPTGEPDSEQPARGFDAARVAAALASSAGTAFVAAHELFAIADVRVLIAWSVTALILVGLGARMTIGILRVQAYALVLLAAWPALFVVIFEAALSGREIVSVAAVTVGLFVIGFIGRQATSYAAERTAAGLVAVVGTGLLTLLKWRVLPQAAIAPAWAAEALVLVWLGSRRHRAGQRWQGYAAALLALGYVTYWSSRQTFLAAQSNTEPGLLVLVATVGVVLAAFAAALIGRMGPERASERGGSPTSVEDLALYFVPAAAAYALVVFEAGWFGAAALPLALATTGALMVASGTSTRAIDIRGIGYSILGAAAMSIWVVLVARPDGASIFPIIAALGLLFLTGLALRRPLRTASADLSEPNRRAEDVVRVSISLLASFLGAMAIVTDGEPNLVTMGWGVEGIGLLFVGFAARERALRLGGLGLLFVCILKLFVYDLRELEPLARILSFVGLGIVLLGVSWTYTRFKEDLRRWL